MFKLKPTETLSTNSETIDFNLKKVETLPIVTEPIVFDISHEVECNPNSEPFEFQLNTENTQCNPNVSTFDFYIMLNPPAPGPCSPPTPPIITESFYTTTNLGGFDANELVPQGMTFTQFAMKLLVEIFYPTYVAPSFSLGSNQSGYVEVGTTLSVTLTGNLNRGSILGNIVLGVWSPSAFQNFRAGAAISYILESNFQLSNTRTFNHVVLFGTNSFSGSVTYAQGSQPLASNGANYESPLPSGTLSGNNTGLYGLYRQFYGNVVNHPVNSAQVRALESSNLENVNSFSATISSTKFTIAIRATKTLVSAITANNENITSSFILTTFTVNDAAGNPINYNIYNFESALPLGLLTNFVLA
jgi:hypothetical protein